MEGFDPHPSTAEFERIVGLEAQANGNIVDVDMHVHEDRDWS